MHADEVVWHVIYSKSIYKMYDHVLTIEQSRSKGAIGPAGFKGDVTERLCGHRRKVTATLSSVQGRNKTKRRACRQDGQGLGNIEHLSKRGTAEGVFWKGNWEFPLGKQWESSCAFSLARSVWLEVNELERVFRMKTLWAAWCYKMMLRILGKEREGVPEVKVPLSICCIQDLLKSLKIRPLQWDFKR